MNAASNSPNLPDRWTCSAGYQRAHQNEQQVETIIGLLELADAAGLVDIGCGNGALAVAAAGRYLDCRVWACDALQTAVAECCKRAGEAGVVNLSALVASAESVPLPDACADRALMRNVLHHVADAEAAFAEIGRLLRPGGRLVFEGPCNAWDRQMGKLLTDVHLLMDDSHRRTYLRPADIVRGLTEAGLRAEPADYWPYAFRLGAEQVALIRQHKAQQELRLCQRDDGQWFVELKIVRIIGTKGSDCGRDSDEDKT